MYYNKLNKAPTEYLQDWGIEYKRCGKELLLKCLFSGCDAYTKGARHLYMNEETGAYLCFRCGAKGNLVTLAKHLGKDVSYKRTKVIGNKSSKLLVGHVYVDY